MRKSRSGKNTLIDCNQCKTQSDCCRTGAWIDLEEAKRIVDRGIEGMFYHLEKDDDFPSGWRVGTSFEYDPCSFLEPDGLCAIHKIDYGLKPRSCKEFPYEGAGLSGDVGYLCTLYKSKSRSSGKNAAVRGKK